MHKKFVSNFVQQVQWKEIIDKSLSGSYIMCPKCILQCFYDLTAQMTDLSVIFTTNNWTEDW